jgi:hypothetical protein
VPQAKPSLALAGLNIAIVLGAALSVLDYVRVASIFSANDGAAPLEERIAAGQRSVFFAHHADYAAVTSGMPSADPAHAFDRASHYLLDTRLMIAWSRALAERGQLDEARYLAERLREFRKTDAEDFFSTCPVAVPVEAAPAAASAASAPFQCSLPVRAPGWREFMAH